MMDKRCLNCSGTGRVCDGETCMACEGSGRMPMTAEDYEERINELEKTSAAHHSLLTELWNGVREHGLNGNIGKRDGERLIHAYCGGIVTVMNERDELRASALAAEAEVEAWKLASGLERGGNPDAVTPQDAEEHWTKVGQASQALMAEVAMLLLDVPRLRETRKALAEAHDRMAELVGDER